MWQFVQKICIGLGVFFILQTIKPIKFEAKGCFGIVFTVALLWGLGTLITMLYEGALLALK